MNQVFVTEWKPEVLELFSEEQLQVLDNLLMYAQYQFDIPYCDSVYEGDKDTLLAVQHKLTNSYYKTVS